MPRPTEEEKDIPPRMRTFADGIEPREPMKLTVDSILDSQAKAASAYKAAKLETEVSKDANFTELAIYIKDERSL